MTIKDIECIVRIKTLNRVTRMYSDNKNIECGLFDYYKVTITIVTIKTLDTYYIVTIKILNV